ncbi:hypothetical protein CFR74_08390 [Novacetimonas hansenii]|nr:hypothetical protein CFR74_08390 [Novacetimonas hansenii]
MDPHLVKQQYSSEQSAYGSSIWVMTWFYTVCRAMAIEGARHMEGRPPGRDYGVAWMMANLVAACTGCLRNML